jgi:hypothetical protein
MNLSHFKTEPFPKAIKTLFAELNIPINPISEDVFPLRSTFPAYKANNPAHALIDELYAIGTVDTQAFDSVRKIDVSKLENEDYEFIMIFGIKLKNTVNPTRTQLAEITRLANASFNKSLKGNPVTVVFKYGDNLALSNTERQKYLQAYREGEKLGKVSLLRDININKTHSGHWRIIKSLSIDSIRSYDKKNKVEDFGGLYKGWQQVFGTQILNEQFYKDYQKLSVSLVRSIFPSQIKDKIKAHQGALNLLNRLMFIYFIQKKGWLMNDEEFIFHLWQDYKSSNSEKNTFHSKWLNKIFFKAFNNKVFNDPEIFKIFPEKYHTAILNFPYLNGGLFSMMDEDDFKLDDTVFEEIFSYLQGYIFTISEDTAEEINLEINPELLGKMYEGMINATDLNDIEAENGIVYTERPEINFMVKRSFVEVLSQKLSNTFSREFLYHFCFDKHTEKVELIKHYKANVELLRNAILSTTSLDPSCGSGSMLIGVIQLQIELLRAIDEFLGKPHTPKDDFYLKKQIISECIYGVDIKEWAVRIAELRFWLNMISEVEFTTEELCKEPLLPNLDFKIRQGNSLLQQIGSLDFSIKGLFKGRKRNAGATRKLNEFIKKKKDFITNQGDSNTTYSKLKEEELFVFREFIKELKIENLAQIEVLRKGDGQYGIFGGESISKPEQQAKRIQIIAENLNLDKILVSIKETGRLPFSYDIDFMEIFLTSENPGFDLIIGNPPYVRQEDILPAEDAIELERLLQSENKEEKAQINKMYKEQLSAKVFETYPFLATKAKTVIDGKNKTVDIYGKKVPGRSDLYVYFQLLLPSLLNTKGTFCFIISNSWLDVDFGGFVQQFLLKHTNLYSVYDCNVRSFSASVNTIIYLHSAIINDKLSQDQYKTLKPENRIVKFIMNKMDYVEAAYAPLLIEQEHSRENTFRPYYRAISKTSSELWQEGYEEENFEYISNKWGGKYLRAPEIYFTILEKGRNKLIPLKKIADIRRGITTGANEFFILSIEKAMEWGIEDEFLVPIVKSSREVKKYLASSNDVQNKLLLIKNKDQDLSPNVSNYLSFGEQNSEWDNNAPAYRSSCQGRSEWYVLGERKIPGIACNYMIDTMMRFFDFKSLVVDNFQELHLKNVEETKNALYTLNSTVFNLLLNIMGRGNFGDGLMKLQTFEVAELLTLNPKLFKIEINNNFLTRDQNNIYEELGFDKTIEIRSQDPNPKIDRKEIDDVIFDELGLTEDERKEVYWATAELVKQRLDKAASR